MRACETTLAAATNEKRREEALLLERAPVSPLTILSWARATTTVIGTTPTMLADRLGMPKSTVHVHLETLEEEGY